MRREVVVTLKVLIICLIISSCALNNNQNFQRKIANKIEKDEEDLRVNKFSIEGRIKNNSAIKDIDLYLSYKITATRNAFWGDCTKKIESLGGLPDLDGHEFRAFKSVKKMVKVDHDLKTGLYKKNIVLKPGRCRWKIANFIGISLYSPNTKVTKKNLKHNDDHGPQLNLFFHRPNSKYYGQTDLREINLLTCRGDKTKQITCHQKNTSPPIGLMAKDKPHTLNIEIY